MTEYFTADEHYGHDMVIEYCKRPFKNNQLMTREIIKRHNTTVKEEDTVYHIGDFAMAGPDRATYVEGLLRRLNGTHILILGNHDQIKPLRFVNIGFQSVHTSLILEREGRNIVMAHDPSIWNAITDKGVIFICAHIHNLFKSIPKKNIINVGVDVWDFTPVTLAQILNELEGVN